MQPVSTLYPLPCYCPGPAPSLPVSPPGWRVLYYWHKTFATHELDQIILYLLSHLVFKAILWERYYYHVPIQTGDYCLKRSSNSVNKGQPGIWAPSTLVSVSVHLTIRPSYLVLIQLLLCCFCSLSQPGLHVSGHLIVDFQLLPLSQMLKGEARSPSPGFSLLLMRVRWGSSWGKAVSEG